MKNKSFKLIALFSCMSLQLFAFEISEQQKQDVLQFGTGYSVFVAALGAGSYIAYSCNIPEEFYVKNNYPYAQIWYDEMAQKYPDAHFDQKVFLQARPGILDNELNWQNSFNQIYAPKADLQIIDEIYKKKAANVAISQEDSMVLHSCEFVLLNKAAHIKNNDKLLSFIGMGLIYPGLEIAHAVSTGTSPNLDLLDRLMDPKVYALSAIGTIVYYSYLRYQEARADKFACNQAVDQEVLRGGLNFFKACFCGFCHGCISIGDINVETLVG